MTIKILIVDDAKDMRYLISSYLRREGYEDLFFAPNIKEAREFLNLDQNTDKAEADLIILDVFLEDGNGIDLCAEFRKQPRFEDVPVIIITASTKADHLKQAFEVGANDFIYKPINRIELQARVKSLLTLRKEVLRRKERERELMATTEKLKKANKKLEKMASLDGLTGLPNRRYFDQILKKEFYRSRREGYKISLLIIDIDHFKQFNDTYGHLAGDDALKKAAEKIDEMARRPADLAARYGGEEFAVILPATDNKGALKVAEDIRKGIMELEIKHESSEVADILTVSAGVNTIDPPEEINEEKINDFIDQADQALYQAKENGRNRVSSGGE